MCQKWPDLPATVFFTKKKGNPEDLPFSASEFSNACVLVQDGPFDDSNENWVRLVRMYERLVTLRIDLRKFFRHTFPQSLRHSAIFEHFEQYKRNGQTPRGCHPFHLPFSAEEFLKILVEAETYEKSDRLSATPQYKGSRRLFLHMVHDLSTYEINLKEFLADHVPADMEKNRTLLWLLSSAQGTHTDNFVIDRRKFFRILLGRHRTGQIEGPLTHLQAAMFVQSLEVAQAPEELYPLEAKQQMCELHDDCAVGKKTEDIALVVTPCCQQIWPKCCLMQILLSYGPDCPDCKMDMEETYREHSRLGLLAKQ
jgi:hypothetical protein